MNNSWKLDMPKRTNCYPKLQLDEFSLDVI